MSDLKLAKSLERGSKGKAVRLVQEWLTLNGMSIGIDGDFGPATERAVIQFRSEKGLPAGGIVDEDAFGELIKPMTRAMSAIMSTGDQLGRSTIEYARQHLNEHPREVGGQNCGPWVRLYMKGNEGTSWPWCAGFVSYLLQQACSSAGRSIPIALSFSCDSLAASARERGLFLTEAEVQRGASVSPGSLFLQRRTATDWTHTGIVLEAHEETFDTIEGNTNDEGSREGYEVCQRTRGYGNKDFILI